MQLHCDVLLHRFLRKILLKHLLDTQGKGFLVPHHRSEVKEIKLTGCYAKTRKPVTFVCPEPALKLLNLRLEVNKHTRVDFSIQLHSVAGGRSGESKGLGLISDDDDSENKLIQHRWIATTVALIIIIFINIIISIFLFRETQN